MESRDAILYLINKYGLLIDIGDLDSFANLFEYAEWGMEEADRFVGKDQLLEALSNVIIYENGTPRTKHVTANIDLEINEETRKAQSQCYVTVFQQTTEFPLQAMIAGHYFDNFERSGETWRFKKRQIKHQLVGNMTAHLRSIGEIVPGE